MSVSPSFRSNRDCEIHLTNRINACDLHHKRNEFDPFLKRIITGDEKWIVYNNVSRKRSWYNNWIKRPELINRNVVIFHQDNAGPHTSFVRRQKLRELAWVFLMFPPCSTDRQTTIFFCLCRTP